MTLLNIPCNLSWCTERQTLSVNSLAAVVVGLDGLDPVLLLRDAAALVGDLHDIEELLADVGGNYNSCLSSLSLLSPEDGVGPLLSPGGGLEVGVIVLLELVYGKLEQIPVKGFFQDAVVTAVPADGPGTGDGDGVGVFTAEDGVVGAVGIAAALAGQRVLGEGFLATEYEPVGDERQEPSDGAVAPGAGVDGEIGVEVVDGGGLGLGRGVGELDADPGQELVEDLPDGPGVDGVLVPPHLIAGGPAVHEAPAVKAVEGEAGHVGF